MQNTDHNRECLADNLGEIDELLEKDPVGRCDAKHGMSRRKFLRTSSGMAAAFLAMNSVYGNAFDVSGAVMGNERGKALRQQFIFDVETYLDDTGYMFENYVRQIYLNSDIDLTVLCGAFSNDDSRELLNNARIAEVARMVNTTAGHTRMLAQAVLTPGQPGWMDAANQALAEFPPACWGLYAVGETLSSKPGHPFWLSDEKLMYPFYEKAQKAGIVNLCIHNELTPRDYTESWVGVRELAMLGGLGKAAVDWPGLNFIVYHGAFRPFFNTPGDSLGDFENTGRIKWCSDLAEVPAQNGASNIYAEIGTTFASTASVNPRLTAAILGIWIKGMGATNVVWGTGSGREYASPQWQIEAMRRMEIPEDMQEKYGFAPLGGADSMVKQMIFGLNSARLYNLDLRAG